MMRYTAILAGLVLFAGSPVFAEAVKHDDAMCTKHCNIMDLQKKVDGPESRRAIAGQAGDQRAPQEGY